MASPERSLARKCGTCLQEPGSCASCNCPVRAKVACLLTDRSPDEFLETFNIPSEIRGIIMRLPRDVFEFEWPLDACWHQKRWKFPHPVLHQLPACSNDELLK